MKAKDGLTVKHFPSQRAWTVWLDKHHASSPGLWLQIARKGSGLESVSHPEALEAALCYGWIDGQSAESTNGYWLRRFTPRRPGSKWSEINRAAVVRLEAQGRLKPAGLREIEAAKRDGRWDAAYAPQRTMEVPADLGTRLKTNPRARRFFETLDSKNRYAILYRIHEAKKAETRARRIEKFMQMLEAGQPIH